MQMTKDQLTDHLKATVLPMITDLVGKQVKDVVAEAISKAGEAGSAGKNMLAAVTGDEKATTHDGPVVKTPEGYEMPLSMFQDLSTRGGFTGHVLQRPPNSYGLGFGRCLRAFAKAKMNGHGPQGVVRILNEWGDKASAKFYEEKALAASDATAGGFLVPPQFSQEVIEFLRPASIVRKLGPMVVQMPTGTFRMPKVTQGATFTYQGENLPAGKTQPQFGNVTLTFKKLTGVVPISNDLLRYSSPSADSVVRDDVVNGMSDAENRNFIRGDGTAATPRGFLNWCLAANNITANQTSNLANFTQDMGFLIVALMNNNIKMIKPGWMFSPRTWNFMMTVQTANGVFPYRDELMRGTFWGWPYGVTTAIPINLGSGATGQSEIYLIDFQEAVLGEAMSLVVDASQEAAYNDGGTVVSAYSQDQTVIRAIAEHDLVMRRQEAVAVLSSVVYR